MKRYLSALYIAVAVAVIFAFVLVVTNMLVDILLQFGQLQ